MTGFKDEFDTSIEPTGNEVLDDNLTVGDYEPQVTDYVDYFDNSGESYLAQVIKVHENGTCDLFVFNSGETVTNVNHSSKLTRKIKDDKGVETEHAYFGYSNR